MDVLATRCLRPVDVDIAFALGRLFVHLFAQLIDLEVLVVVVVSVVILVVLILVLIVLIVVVVCRTVNRLDSPQCI